MKWRILEIHSVNNTAIGYRESNALICSAFFIYFTSLQFSQ